MGKIEFFTLRSSQSSGVMSLLKELLGPYSAMKNGGSWGRLHSLMVSLGGSGLPGRQEKPRE